jgi:hypothetical protein
MSYNATELAAIAERINALADELQEFLDSLGEDATDKQ